MENREDLNVIRTKPNTRGASNSICALQVEYRTTRWDSKSILFAVTGAHLEEKEQSIWLLALLEGSLFGFRITSE